MAETTTGIRRVLSHPAVYDLWSQVVGGKRAQTMLVRDHVRPWAAARVLDVGCGTGELLDFLGDVRYTGVDFSADYIAHARERYGERGERATFLVSDARSMRLPEQEFDLALAIGVLHHLDDADARGVFALAAKALGPGGRMITVDPTFVDGQSRLARFTIARDRGRNVRTPEAYRQLAPDSFSTVDAMVRSDLIRIPYTHCVLECEGPIRRSRLDG